MSWEQAGVANGLILKSVDDLDVLCCRLDEERVGIILLVGEVVAVVQMSRWYTIAAGVRLIFPQVASSQLTWTSCFWPVKCWLPKLSTHKRDGMALCERCRQELIPQRQTPCIPFSSSRSTAIPRMMLELLMKRIAW